VAALAPGDAATLTRLLEEMREFHKELRQYTLRVVRGDTSKTAMVREGIQQNAQIAALISLAAVVISILSLALILRENRQQSRAAEASRRSAEEAGLANRAKSRFLSMMSHELRNPLNGVLGPLALLDQSDIGKRQRALVAQAKHCGQSMLQMLGGLLDYAEMQDGRFELQVEPFRLRALVDAVSDSLAGQGAGGLAVTLAEGAPDRIYGDKDRFRQVFMHLCEYVLEAAEPEAIQLLFAHDGRNLIGRIGFSAAGPAMDWKLDLLMGLNEVAPDQVSADALRPLIARGLIAAGSGVLTLADTTDGRRAIEVSLPARPIRLERIRVYLETRSAAMAAIYQSALKSERVVFAEPGNRDPVDVVLVDSTSVGEDALMVRLRSRFPGALFVSLGTPQAPEFFDDVLETPGDMGQLRTSILGRLAS
jgi:K+-sensing histidine kinase KdpD